MPAHKDLNAETWARAGLSAGAAVSVAMNFASNWHVARNGDTVRWVAPWDDGLAVPEFVKLAVTAALPLILLVVVEVIARSVWPRGRGWKIGPIGVVAAGATMALLSFLEVFHLWRAAGVEGTVAGALALFPDFVMTTCSVALLAATVHRVEETRAETARETARETLAEVAPETPRVIVQAPRETPLAETPETPRETAPASPDVSPVATLGDRPGDVSGDVDDQSGAWVAEIEKVLEAATVNVTQRRSSEATRETPGTPKATRSATSPETPKRRRRGQATETVTETVAMPTLDSVRSLVKAEGDQITVDNVVAHFGLQDVSPETRRKLSKQLYKAKQTPDLDGMESAE